MLDKFLNGKLAVYIEKGARQNVEMVSNFCFLIEPYIKSWAFSGMSLYGYLASEASGPCHFVVHGTHMSGAAEEYIERNNIGEIITLSEFFSSTTNKTKPELSNDEYYGVLFSV